MNMENQKFYSAQDSLSNIELFYSLPENISDNFIFIRGDEHKHLVRVMRHKIGDEIFATNGIGKIFKTKIFEIEKDFVKSEIISVIEYRNIHENIFVCIPQLRNDERLEFALEKCVELGITNFLIFKSARTIQKKLKIERLQKICISAMKQSLHSFLPQIVIVDNLSALSKLKGEKIIFEQNANESFVLFIKNNSKIFRDNIENIFFIFGPEGGLNDEEINNCKDAYQVKLNSNRLRAETAIISAVSTYINFKL